jgi:hypothetical protein
LALAHARGSQGVKEKAMRRLSRIDAALSFFGEIFEAGFRAVDEFKLAIELFG